MDLFEIAMLRLCLVLVSINHFHVSHFEEVFKSGLDHKVAERCCKFQYEKFYDKNG